MAIPSINFNKLGEGRFDLKIRAEALFASQAPDFVAPLDPTLVAMDEAENAKVQEECKQLHEVLDSQFSWKVIGGGAISAVVLSIGLFRQSLRWGIPGFIGCALFSLQYFFRMQNNSQMYAKIDQARMIRLREKVATLDQEVLIKRAERADYAQLQKISIYFRLKLPTS